MVEEALRVCVTERAIEHLLVFKDVGHEPLEGSQEIEEHLNVEVQKFAVNFEAKFNLSVVYDHKLFGEAGSVLIALNSVQELTVSARRLGESVSNAPSSSFDTLSSLINVC